MRFDITDGFKKKRTWDSRRRYLRYDDVFMSSEQQEHRTEHSSERQRSEAMRGVEQKPPLRSQPRNMRYAEPKETTYDYDQDDLEQQYEHEPSEPELRGNFSQKNSGIINEKMLRYQKRQLPPLQRYTPNQHRDIYTEFNKSYWDEDYPNMGSRSRQYAFSDIWRKFVVTFSSILSLVCLSWIAYNWNSDRTDRRESSNGPTIIEPTQPSFKVLPDSPGGEEIPHKDKMVYGRISRIPQNDVDEKLLPPFQEEEEEPRSTNQQQSFAQIYHGPIETYSIVDDRIYYIKISAGKDRGILESEAVLLKKKFSQLLTGKNCSVKRVSNSSGEQKDAVLIGPFASQESAVNVARELGMQCYVISVKD
ncbi:MAG: SPOR domain-containing protein [Holosporales bacterium]|jgi:hypothetical protein|nr:SPOR domain-containing protein [Holosporales bacterium]